MQKVRAGRFGKSKFVLGRRKQKHFKTWKLVFWTIQTPRRWAKGGKDREKTKEKEDEDEEEVTAGKTEKTIEEEDEAKAEKS